MRIAQFDVVIVNVEVAGLLGFAFNDDEVPAGMSDENDFYFVAMKETKSIVE